MRLCTENMPPCVIVEVTPGPPQTVAVDGGQWEPLVPAKGSLTPRHEACFVMVDGKAYLLGGRGERPVDVFDPATGEWRQREGYGKRLHHMQCVAKDGNIWIASSWTGGFPREENVAEVIVYHTRNDTWGTKAGLPEQRRRGGAAAVLRDGKIYVVGGNRGGHGEHATALGWMDAYDIERDEWEIELPELPEARDHVGGGMVDGRLCVAGGRDSGTRSFFRRVVVSAWCYDFGERVWVRGDDLEVGRAGAATSSVCGELMVAGGETGRDLAWERVDLFDGERWRRAPDLKRGRHGTGLAIGEGRVWIASGSGNRGGRPELESMEQYVRAGCAGP